MKNTNRFCVYVHKKKTDGVIFYVGKGTGKRPRNRTARSEYWKRIVLKHGLAVSIVKGGLSESAAFELESLLIAEIGRANLCNMTDGGGGCSGRVMGEKQRRRASLALKGIKPYAAIEAARKANSKKIGTACGLRFDSSARAVEWLRNNGHTTACKAGIHSTLKGASRTSYGYQWRRVLDNGELSSETFSPAPPRAPVKTECGMSFDSPKDATAWLVSIGHKKAQAANICSCCKGRVSTAYGYKWKYASEEQ